MRVILVSVLVGAWCIACGSRSTPPAEAVQSNEAVNGVAKMVDGLAAHLDAQVKAGGAIVFPSAAPLTPGTPTDLFCRDGKPKPHVSDASTWAGETWKALGFKIEGPSNYAYEFATASNGSVSQFTARALGDLDCDGVLSTFERVGEWSTDPGPAPKKNTVKLQTDKGKLVIGRGVYMATPEE